MADWGLMGAMVATGVALVCAWLWRRAEATIGLRVEEGKRLEERQSELETALAREEKARRRQAEELAGYRKKADKTRKRGAKATPQPLGTVSRIQDIEAALARTEAERDRALSEQERASSELERVRALLEKATARPEPTPAVVAEAAGEGESDTLESQLDQSRKRLGELEEALRVAGQTEARLRKRMANQEQLYASIRGELDAKKDRLRTQAEQLERLQALKVAVID